jgi:MspA
MADGCVCVTLRAMVPNRVTAILACLLVGVASAPTVHAEPEEDASYVEASAESDETTELSAVDSPHAGLVPSAEPATTKTPDGWTLKLSSKDETVMPTQPLTTALSSRAYVVGGTFTGSLVGPGEPRGILEVGYQIGCGIDMSTSNGVTLVGTGGMTTSLGTTGPFLGPPTGFLPILSFPASGAVSVALKPGIVNIVPVDKMEFKGPEPWVMISNFQVKIDGCVGQSFIRSYATITRKTEQSDVVLSWLGTTKTV